MVGIPVLMGAVSAVGIRRVRTAVRVAVVRAVGNDGAAGWPDGADLPAAGEGDSLRHHRLHLEPDLIGF